MLCEAECCNSLSTSSFPYPIHAAAFTGKLASKPRPRHCDHILAMGHRTSLGTHRRNDEVLFVLRHFSTNPYRKRFAEDTQSTVYGRDLEVLGGSTSRAKQPSQFAFATTAASGSAMTVLWDVPFCWIPAVIMSIASRPLRATSSDSR